MLGAADLIARHAVWVLVAACALLLILLAALWRLLIAYAPSLWRLGLRVWQAPTTTAFAERLVRVPVIGAPLTTAVAIARHLGIYAVLAFLVAAGGVAAFFEVAEEIGVGQTFAEFDVALTDALRDHLGLGTLQVFSIITRLGDLEVLVGLGVAVAAALLLLQRWTLAIVWIFTTVSGGLLNQLLKAIFERTRPIHEHGLVSETSWSFPSGHAAGSMLVYGLLGYLIVRHTKPAWHIPVALVTVALIIFVGSSRVLLQVHYLSDILAGYASSAVWLALCIAGLETLRWQEKRKTG